MREARFSHTKYARAASKPIRAFAGRRRWPHAALGTAAALLATAFSVSSASALPIGCAKVNGKVLCPQVSYEFQTLNNTMDLTFNQLLGINQSGVIAGYFGSGAQGHPNQGYLLFPPYVQNYYASNNFPNNGAVQTQVTGINNGGVLVGFYSTMNNASINGAAPIDDNHGWYKLHGQFYLADFPTTSPASPPVDQLLGVNGKNVAVGFFTDATGNNHGYTYGINNHRFQPVNVPNFTNVTAAAINDKGDIAGFGTTNSNSEGFLLVNGKTTPIKYPGSSQTQALGVNNNDEVVGDYTVGSGSSAAMHGFTWYPGYGFHKVDAPQGADTTTINGVNDCGDIVGFYVDSKSNTDGLLGNTRYSGFVSKAKRIRTKLPRGC